MTETTVKSEVPAPRRKAGWVKWVGVILAGLLALVIVVYFVATSSAFFKGVILPKAGKSMNATITVSDASISPFSQVVLKGLKIQTTGSEPLVSAPEVRLRYSLMDIIRGTIKIDEVAVVSPTITLVQNPDGTSNLDPMLKSTAGGQEAKKSVKSSEPLKVDIRKVQITDGTLRQIKLYAGTNRDLVEVSKLNLALNDIKNGQPGKLVVSSDLSLHNNPPAPGSKGQLTARMNGEFAIGLTADLKPGTVKGSTRLEVISADGALAQASGFAANLDCNLTPTEIQELSLKFAKGTVPLGQVRVQGPFSSEKVEGKLTVQVLGIDRQLLNLAAAGTGMDFGSTALSSTNLIQISQGGKVVNAVGQLSLSNLSVTRTNQTTPVLDLASSYNTTVDATKGNAVLQSFTLAATQKGNVFLKGELTNPMTIAWGTGGNEVGDSALNIAVSRLDLADWKVFLGNVAPEGVVNSQLKLLSQQAGKKLTFDLGTQLEKLTVRSGTNQISQTSVSLSAKGTVANLEQFTFSQYKLQLGHREQTVLTISGTGAYDLKTETADLQVGLQALLPELVQFVPQPDAVVSSGTVDLNLHVTQQKQAQNISGSMFLTNFVGHFGSNDFRGFAATAAMDVTLNPQKVQIAKFSGNISEGGKPGGNFDVNGSYDRTNNASKITAKLVDFNQNGLRPFVEPMLTDKKLVSLVLGGNLSLQYDPAGSSDIKASLVATNLVVTDAKTGTSLPPLYARLSMDAGLNKQVADLRSLELGLTPTDKGSNVLKLAGLVDSSRSNAITGNLKLSADSLDVTRYYDLFAGSPSKAPATSPSSSGGAAGPKGEPEPMNLPFTNFTADATISRFYLREIAITNLHAAVKIDGGKIVAKPIELVLNGAKVGSSIEVDVGVPGYRYSLDFSAVQVPLAPVVNSFQPERKGQVNGTLTGLGQVTGAGATGLSLQKLAGKFDIGTTNLNLAIPSLRSPLLKKIVNVIAVVPDLLKNPNAGLDSLTGALLGGGGASGQKGGFVDELTQSPIDVIQGRGVIGDGRMELSDVLIQSPAFQAGARGSIQFRKTATMDEAITNSSLALPLTVALRRSLAEKIDFVPAGTPTNLAYVKLPDYVTVKGTVGVPKTEIDKKALLGTALQQWGGKIPGVDQKTGSLIQGLGNMLSGHSQSSTNAPSGTNQSTKSGNSLQSLGGLLGGATTSTNAPVSTNAPGTNQDPVGSLLNQLLGPKKKK
jgi:uncharacterized protein involved in outer membrane biogenesis